jgi:hypothetical protein
MREYAWEFRPALAANDRGGVLAAWDYPFYPLDPSNPFAAFVGASRLRAAGETAFAPVQRTASYIEAAELDAAGHVHMLRLRWPSDLSTPIHRASCCTARTRPGRGPSRRSPAPPASCPCRDAATRHFSPITARRIASSSSRHTRARARAPCGPPPRPPPPKTSGPCVTWPARAATSAYCRHRSPAGAVRSPSVSADLAPTQRSAGPPAKDSSS